MVPDNLWQNWCFSFSVMAVYNHDVIPEVNFVVNTQTGDNHYFLVFNPYIIYWTIKINSASSGVGGWGRLTHVLLNQIDRFVNQSITCEKPEGEIKTPFL